MAKAIITFKVMPGDAGIDLEPIKEAIQKIAKEKGAIGEMLVEEQPIAFGLKAVILRVMYEVENGDFDGIAAEMQEVENVQTAEVAGMDLPLG